MIVQLDGILSVHMHFIRSERFRLLQTSLSWACFNIGKVINMIAITATTTPISVYFFIEKLYTNILKNSSEDGMVLLGVIDDGDDVMWFNNVKVETVSLI